MDPWAGAHGPGPMGRAQAIAEKDFKKRSLVLPGTAPSIFLENKFWVTPSTFGEELSRLFKTYLLGFNQAGRACQIEVST